MPATVPFAEDLFTSTKDELIHAARLAAGNASIDSSLVCAVVEQESGWEPCAIRFEPGFDERYEKGKISNITEEIARSMSWGLMQVMGETARDLGWKSHLGKLLYPGNGLMVGCAKLRACLEAHGGSVADALLMYNGGGDPGYPAAVMARMPNY